MELEEFVRLDPSKIRRDKELMQLFVGFYKAAFSFEPNCAGCVFKSGFRKLQRFAESDGKSVKFDKNTVNMTTKTTTFELKSKYRVKILTYKKDGIMNRSYGYNLTEEFARELVASGKSDLFVTLPSEFKGIPERKFTKTEIHPFEGNEDLTSNTGLQAESINKTLNDYDVMDWKNEILPLYAKAKERTGKQAKSRKKVDVIAFLEEHES